MERWTTVLLDMEDTLAHLLSILQRPDNNAHYSVPLHVIALLCRHPLCADFLLSHSTRCLPLIDRALGQAALLLVQHYKSTSGAQHAKASDRLHIRPYCLLSTQNRSSIGVIRSADVGRLVCVLGNVMRVQPARMYEYASEWQCDKCGGRFYAYADDDQESRIEQPKYCRASEQPEANRENGAWQQNARRVCRSTFINQTATSLARDVQHVRIQDNLHRSHLSLPRSITLRLTDEQCESVKVGDVVQVCGMVRRQWSPLVIGQRVNIDLYLDAYHIAVIGSSAASAAAASSTRRVPMNEFDAYWEQQRTVARGLKARNQIVSAMAPTLVGMFMPKLTCMLALVGGVRKEDGGMEGEEEVGRNDVISIRGDIHVLMVGDAGVGKSVLLQSACGLSPRGVLTTGAGTTSAGLTVAATRAAGSRANTAFTLEPGALVLADSGVCCIDEFNTLSKNDRTSLLEAMEQQTISIAKGGQVTRLNTRTAVIAALNPKQGKYDHDLDLTINTALGSALLSRFDVILALLDTRDERWDEKVAEQLLQVLPTTEDGGVGVKKQEKEEALLDELKDDEDEVVPMTQRASQRLASTQQAATASQLLTMRWSVATVHSYIGHLRSSFFPVLSPACESLLKRYYQVQRRSDGRKQARVGVRLLESLIRLTQAHARLMWRRDECELLDAVMAVVVMEHSVLSCGLLVRRKTNVIAWSSVMPTTVSALHADFSTQPDEEYEQWETLILTRLELTHLRHDTQPPSDGVAEDDGVRQQPSVHSFHDVAQQSHISIPSSWPLPPSMTIPLTSAPPPPPSQHSAYVPPQPRQAPVMPPPSPSYPPRQSSPAGRQQSSAPTRPSPSALPQPPLVTPAPAPLSAAPASILKASSLSAAPLTGRLLSRKSTVSFAGAPPPSAPDSLGFHYLIRTRSCCSRTASVAVNCSAIAAGLVHSAAVAAHIAATITEPSCAALQSFHIASHTAAAIASCHSHGTGVLSFTCCTRPCEPRAY